MRDVANELTTWTDCVGNKAADEAAKAALGALSCLLRRIHSFRTHDMLSLWPHSEWATAWRWPKCTTQRATRRRRNRLLVKDGAKSPHSVVGRSRRSSSSKVGRSCWSLTLCLVLCSQPLFDDAGTLGVQGKFSAWAAQFSDDTQPLLACGMGFSAPSAEELPLAVLGGWCPPARSMSRRAHGTILRCVSVSLSQASWCRLCPFAT